ncbi:hypothetical protein ACFL1K_01690 [Candidatus Omnitrophota bacterium]
MDKSKLQRKIAKEGLIVLGIIVIRKIVTVFYYSTNMGRDRFFYYTILVLSIYGAIRFVMWAIKVLGVKSKLKNIFMKHKKTFIREGSLIVGSLVLAGLFFGLASAFKLPEFDINTSMTVDENYKVEMTEENKKPIERVLGKSIDGMPEQQVQMELEKRFNINRKIAKIRSICYQIFSFLALLGLISYPAYSLIRFTRWTIKR